MRLHPRLHLRKKASYWLDWAVLAVGVAGPLMTLPQIVLIFSTKDASGVALLSWLMWAILDLPWVFYGIMHREPPIATTYALWFLANSAVFVGALMYGGSW